MATDKKEKKKTKKLKTPRFRVSFAHVFKPHQMDADSKLQYSAVALFPKGADLKEMKAAAFKAGKEKFGEKWISKDGKWPAKFRSPFRNGGEKEDLDGYDETVTFVTFNANVDYPPTVFDKQVERIDATDPDCNQRFYSGCWAVATVNVYAYDNPKNKGVAFGLLGIQIVADGEKFGGGGGADASDFEAVEDEGGSDDPDNYGDDDDPDNYGDDDDPDNYGDDDDSDGPGF